MDLWTLSQIRRKVQVDLDLESEDFVQLEELDGYINEGIDEAESHIHTLGMEDDYFLSYAYLPILAGNDILTLPGDIYATKIRSVIYEDGSLIYPVTRMRGRALFENASLAQHYSGSADAYRYMMVNNVPGEAGKMMLLPKSRVSTTATPTGNDPRFKIWYIRQANRLSADTDVCDIPEFYHFVIKFAKWMVLLKEGHPNLTAAKSELDQQRNIMIDTLSNMVPDKDSEIVPDLTAYDAMS